MRSSTASRVCKPLKNLKRQAVTQRCNHAGSVSNEKRRSIRTSIPAWLQESLRYADIRVLISHRRVIWRLGTHREAAFAFLNIGPDVRRGTGPLRLSLPCLGFLFSLGASRVTFLFPEGSRAVIWLKSRSNQANFQIADHFSRKCIEPTEASFGFPIATGSTFRNFGAMVRMPVVCSIMS